MTRRLLYPEYWASGGTATDPDLDTTAPSFVADRYEKQGWVSEKPPEQWQNFLSQITDEKAIGVMLDGLPSFDSSVTYQEGAMYRKSDKFYRIEGGVEKEVLSTVSSDYLALVATLKSLIDGHLAANNPHKDTVDTLTDGTYLKSYIDNKFGSATDPKTIVYHKARTGAGVHQVTAIQIGSLPADTGGTFTGDVIFLSEATIQLTPSKYVHYNQATAVFEIVNGTYSLGVDAAGNGYLIGSAGIAKIITEANMESIVIKYNNSFALPVPIIQMNIEQDISDAESIGVWTVETDSVPVFEVGKGYVASNSMTLSGVASGIAHTLVVRGYTTKNEVAVVDVSAAATYATLASVITASSKSFTNIKQIWIYPTLSARQKTKLVNA